MSNSLRLQEERSSMRSWRQTRKSTFTTKACRASNSTTAHACSFSAMKRETGLAHSGSRKTKHDGGDAPDSPLHDPKRSQSRSRVLLARRSTRMSRDDQHLSRVRADPLRLSLTPVSYSRFTLVVIVICSFRRWLMMDALKFTHILSFTSSLVLSLHFFSKPYQ